MSALKNERRHLRKSRTLKNAIKSLIDGDLDRLEREIADLRARVAELEAAQETTDKMTVALIEVQFDEERTPLP